MTIVIRPAQPADAVAIRLIIRREVLEGVANFALAPPLLEQICTEILEAGPHPYLVAILSEELVGFARSSAWKSRGAYAWTAELGVYVHHGFVRQGVGVALVTALIDVLRDRGFRTLLAGIALPNPASVGLFEKLGFEHVGTIAANGFKHGVWHDVGYWQAHLGQGPPVDLPGVHE